jgi:hypothetical protein
LIGAFRHVYLERENLQLAKVAGDFSSRELFQALQAIHMENNATLNCSSIFDMRLWAGMIYDDDLFGYLAWTAEFRTSSGLSKDLRNNLVVIVPQNDTFTEFLSKLGAFRGRTIHSARSTDEAWDILFKSTPIIKQVSRFFDPSPAPAERIRRIFGRD